MIQNEDRSAGNQYRENYLHSIQNLIAKKQQESYEEREAFISEIAENREEYREKLCCQLGWPLTIPTPEKVNVRMTKVNLIRDYDVYRMEFEVFDNFWYYGVLFRHRDQEIRPFVISQHGGGGTPELCSNMFGETGNYNGMTERLIALGANVFAPQMLIWDQGQNKDGRNIIDFTRYEIDKDLKQLGGSLTALEVYCLKSVIDYFEKQKYVDPEQIHMAGLSYGGFYTMYAAAADVRIRRALSCAQFNDRIVYNWPDWCWFNAGNTFTDAELAILIAPRKFTICVGKEDALFDVKYAEAEYERVIKHLPECEKTQVEFIVFDGEHEFIKEDDVLKRALFEER